MATTIQPHHAGNVSSAVATNPATANERVTLENALELRDKFSSTFGTVLFGQMIKSMRSTVGKPAYFHGGQAEEMFRGQLDQLLSEKMADASGDRMVKPMFERKFPEWAKVIDQESNQQSTPSKRTTPSNSHLDNLTQLSRR